MDFEFVDLNAQIAKGRKVAKKLAYDKEQVLITFQANRSLRDAATKKCEKLNMNLSAYLRNCIKDLLKLPDPKYK